MVLAVLSSAMAILVPASPSLGLGLSRPAVSTDAIDWPTFAFSAHRDGSNPFEHILTPETVGSLQVAWTSNLGGPTFNQPVLANGMVYQVAWGVLIAMDASTGAVVWKAPLHPADPPIGGITVANGMVYLGDERALWTFDAATGSPVWRILRSTGPTSPLVSGHRVYVGGAGGWLYSANALSGKRGWARLILQDTTFRTLALGAGDLYITTFSIGNDVIRVDAGTGMVAGGISLPQQVLGVSWHDGIEFVGTGNGTGNLFAIDPGTDKVLWEYDSSDNFLSGSPAVQDGVVYSGGGTYSDPGHVFALDAGTGALIWSYETPDGVPGVSVAGGVVYAAADDGIIRALDAANGDLLWSFDARSQVAHPPIIANGMVYVATMAGRMYAFALPAGLGR